MKKLLQNPLVLFFFGTIATSLIGYLINQLPTIPNFPYKTEIIFAIVLILTILTGLFTYWQNQEDNNHKPIKPAVPIRYSNSTKVNLSFKKIVKNPDIFKDCIIEPYILKEFIGSGGSGLVYRAYNHRLGQEFILKIFYPFKSELENIVQIFARAVRGLTSLNHPYIVKTYDFGRLEINQNISFYIVMELVNGQTLDAWNKKISNNNNKLSERIKIALKITTALREAHNCKYIDEMGFEQTGILHGDIKPENILVISNDSPVLIDFMMVDIQRLIDLDVTPTYLIDKGNNTELFGTPGFMAPEQEKKGIVTIKTDIYSLGITFLCLFLPNFPFATEENMIKEYGQDTNKGLHSLINLLSEMENINPEKRPLNMEVVVNRLKNIAFEIGINI